MPNAPTFVPILTNLLPLLGVMVGAGLQYFFSRSADSKRHERILRIDAYSDYLRSIGEAETLRIDPQSTRGADVLARAIAAKARVCVHGSEEVVEALSKFEGDGSLGLTSEKKKFFLDFVAAIRTDVGARGSLGADAIEHILFGRPQ